MNRGEALYAAHLDKLKAQGSILDWKFEAQTFVLGKDMRLTPDFTVFTDECVMELHEVKARGKNGRWRAEEDARAKMKAFPEIWPMIPLYVVWPTDGTHTRWEREEMGT